MGGSRSLEDTREEGGYPDGIWAGVGHTEGSHAVARCFDDSRCVEQKCPTVADAEAGHLDRYVLQNLAGHDYVAKRH